MNNFELTVNNKDIFDFYKTNHLDFESMNLVFLDILKKIMINLDTSVNSNVISNLLSQIKVMDNKIESINTSLIKCQADLTIIFTSKLSEYRRDYMEDLKMVVTSNNSMFVERIIKEANETLLNKTSTIINELIPKNNESLVRDLNTQFQVFQGSLLNETNKLLSSSLDKPTIEMFLTTITQSFGQSQQVLSNLISTSETKLEGKINDAHKNMNEIKEISSLNSSSQKILQDNVSEILKKFENGSSKGNISEHITYNILLTLFPCAQIEHVGNDQKETGDIILIRNNKPKILIENKDHDSKNVPKHEIDKFIRDCEIQNCCGIMFAQHRGISNKENFELQIHNKNVLLYVHEVNFDNHKIKTAVEIVEHFKLKLDELTFNNNDFVIDNETLEEINKDFAHYISQKNNMIKLLKDFHDKMVVSINELKMPALEKYLSSKFAYSFNQNDNICSYCEKYVPKSLAQHLRYCAPAIAASKKESASVAVADAKKTITSVGAPVLKPKK